MKLRIIAIALLGLLGSLLPLPTALADQTVASMSAASALTGTELLYCIQSGANAKCTVSQIGTYFQTLIFPATAAQILAGTDNAASVTSLGLATAPAHGPLTAATNTAWDGVANGFNVRLDLTASGQGVANPTNIIEGRDYLIVIRPYSFTFGSWGTSFDFANGVAPALTANKHNYVVCHALTSWTSTPVANGLLCGANVNFNGNN